MGYVNLQMTTQRTTVTDNQSVLLCGFYESYMGDWQAHILADGMSWHIEEVTALENAASLLVLTSSL